MFQLWVDFLDFQIVLVKQMKSFFRGTPNPFLLFGESARIINPCFGGAKWVIIILDDRRISSATFKTEVREQLLVAGVGTKGVFFRFELHLNNRSTMRLQ